jgi:two-component system sensor histidine kinase BarA
MIVLKNQLDDSLGLDLATLDRMLSVGGEAMRPALIAQLLQDFARLRAALDGQELPSVARAAHELKGLSATIGASALADNAARFDSLAAESSAAVRAAMVLGLGRQIDRLCAILQDRARSSSAA